MKYPLDSNAIADIANDIIQHDRAQLTLIQDLAELLRTAMECVDEEDADDHPWLNDANDLLSGISRRKIEFENHRFNQKNGHSVGQRSPFPISAGEHPGVQIDVKTEADLNAMEAQEFGEELSERDILAMFPSEPKVKKPKQKKLSKMTLEEIEAWEAAQNNANDIYKVSARMKNLARGAVKANLTAQGEMVVNTFTHVVKTLYDFADTIQDKDLKIRLTELVRKQEEAPANLIAALGAGVKLK